MEKNILNKKTSKPNIQINYNSKNNQEDKSNNINKIDINKTKKIIKRKVHATNNNTFISQTTGNADSYSQFNININSILPKPTNYQKLKNNIIRSNTNGTKKNNLSNENKKLKSVIKNLNKDMDTLNKNLKNKEKEINELNNTLLNKDKEIEELKASLNNKEGQGKKILKESIKLIFEQENVKDSIKPWDNINESINRIIDNYLIENEYLKKKLKESEETINYLKERLVSAKKEIIDKEQNIFQIKNENINQIEDLTIKYEQKLFEINYNYKFLKDLYDEAKEENKKLRNNIIDKDEENTNLLIENEDNKNKLKKIEELNKDKNQINENLKNSRREFNKEKELLETNYKLLQNEYNDLKDEYNKILNNSNKIYSNNNIEIMKKLKDLEKENEIIKKKNASLISRIEFKSLKRSSFFEHKTEIEKYSIWEEEFDLKKMAKGAREKNRSFDMYIDNPFYQTMKDKYRELDYNYNILQYLIEKLLGKININNDNGKTVIGICKILKIDFEKIVKI